MFNSGIFRLLFFWLGLVFFLSFWVTQYFQLKNYNYSEDSASVLVYCSMYFRVFFPFLFSVLLLLFLTIPNDTALSYQIRTTFSLTQCSHFSECSSNQQSCSEKMSLFASMRHKMTEDFCILA